MDRILRKKQLVKRKELQHAFEDVFNELVSSLKAFESYLELGGRVPGPQERDWEDDEVLYNHYKTLDSLEITHGIDIGRRVPMSMHPTDEEQEEELEREGEVVVADNQILNYISFIRTAEEKLGRLEGLARAIQIESSGLPIRGRSSINKLESSLASFTIEVYKRISEDFFP